MKGVTIILMKGYDGKSRLSLNQKISMELIEALASDLYFTVSETETCKEPWDYFIATPDKTFSKQCAKNNISIIDLMPGELNSILHQIQHWAVKKSYDALILCAGDIPLLTGVLMDFIKKKLFLGLAKKGKSIVICPSKNDGVSIIAMSPANLWTITSEKGVNNLKVIEGLDREKYPYQIMNDFRAYLDLDHYEDLFSACKIMEKNPDYENRLSKKILGEIVTV